MLIVWFPISVLIASGMHFVWAAGLMLDPAAANATAVHALLLAATTPFVAASLLIIVALSALVGVFMPAKIGAWRVLLMLPQSAILIMSSTGAGYAMLQRSFADGVQRPAWFIIVDQIPIIMITLGYIIAISRLVLQHELSDGR